MVRAVRRLLFSDLRCFLTVRYLDKVQPMPEVDADVESASLFNMADGVVTDKARSAAAQRGVAMHRAKQGITVLPEVCWVVGATGRVCVYEYSICVRLCVCVWLFVCVYECMHV